MWKFMFDLGIALSKVRSSFAIDRIVNGIQTEEVNPGFGLRETSNGSLTEERCHSVTENKPDINWY